MSIAALEQLQQFHRELDTSSLSHVGYLMIDFVWSLENGDFLKEGDQWVYRPNNFITVSVHSTRTQNLTFCFRGNPHEFAAFRHLPLTHAQNGYSRCRVEEFGQVDALFFYIRRAHILALRGRERTPYRQLIIEE